VKKIHGERYYKKHSGNGYENKTDANRTPRVHEILRQDDEVAERAHQAANMMNMTRLVTTRMVSDR
jgi:hypothetical protein